MYGENDYWCWLTDANEGQDEKNICVSDVTEMNCSEKTVVNHR